MAEYLRGLAWIRIKLLLVFLLRFDRMDGWKGVVAVIMYTLIFVKDLDAQFPKTLYMIETGEGIAFGPEEMKRAIEAALASRDDLSELLDQPHSDGALRSYFAKILMHLPH
ncbi:hypothetical protein FE772_13120 [Lysobacter enzymogenes]|nr:hypothetical protein [Lysobacter enzymogenes]QCW26466.1 hypothetical protein FE772_13120 [Lysobacter enzymogenes]